MRGDLKRDRYGPLRVVTDPEWLRVLRIGTGNVMAIRKSDWERLREDQTVTYFGVEG